MANSGSGAEDDSFYSTNGDGATAPTSSSVEFVSVRNSSSQVSHSHFNSSGDRPPKSSSHHQPSSREGGRRERYDENDL